METADERRRNELAEQRSALAQLRDQEIARQADQHQQELARMNERFEDQERRFRELQTRLERAETVQPGRGPMQPSPLLSGHHCDADVPTAMVSNGHNIASMRGASDPVSDDSSVSLSISKPEALVGSTNTS